jgi:hypothetical protein
MNGGDIPKMASKRKKVVDRIRELIAAMRTRGSVSHA